MADTPEDPDAFSPSIFLELPPTPRCDGNDDPDPASSSGDPVLPFISRLLMEEEDEEKDMNGNLLFAADHPALLQAQQPFAEILSASGDGEQQQGALAPSTSKIGGDEADMAMLKLAFLKGMEEASKFLPTTTTSIGTSGSGEQVTNKKPQDGGKTSRRGTTDDDDPASATQGGGRKTKLMVYVPEECDAEMVDQMILNEFNTCLGKIKRLHIATGGEEAKNPWTKNPAKPPAHDEAADLHTLLIRCAQAVGTNDRRSAAQLLAQIKKLSSPTGDPNQRLAHCFVHGLEVRLAGTGSEVYRSLVSSKTASSVEYLKAYQLYLDSCCFKIASFSFSSTYILKAVVGRKKLHIVDYGIDYGLQWPSLLSRLAAMEGGPPELRITGIDLPQPGFRASSRLEEAGRRLSSCAHHLGVPFEFHGITAAKWETIHADDLSIRPDELLVVNSLGPFTYLIDEGVDGIDSPSSRDAVLASISRNIRPDLFVLCVMNASYSSPFFVTRFREALSYYSALFDSLDATLPRDSEQRLLVERDIYGRCAFNVIACEGLDRAERPEAYRQWQVRNHRAGLRQLPLDLDIVQYLAERINRFYHKDFVIDMDQQWLLIGWKGRILYAISTWAAAPADSSISA